MVLLQLTLVPTFLIFPLLLHLAFNLLLELLQLLLCILINNLLSISILIFNRLILLINLLLLPLVLFHQGVLQLPLASLLLLIKFLSLLSDALTHVFLNLTLPVSNLLLLSSLGFFLSILKLMVITTRCLGTLTLTISVQPGPVLLGNSISGPFELLRVLLTELLKLATVLSL